MSMNRWNKVGQEVLDSVLRAVDSGDFTGLSQSVGDVINETVDSISRGMDEFGRELERQAKARGADMGSVTGAWTAGSASRTARERRAEQRSVMREQQGRTVAQPATSGRYRRFLPGQAAGPTCLAVGIVGTCMVGVGTLLGVIVCVVSQAHYGVMLVQDYTSANDEVSSKLKAEIMKFKNI